jgi:hypothetical protein
LGQGWWRDRTHDVVFPLEILLREFIALYIGELEGPADFGFSDAFGHLDYSFALQPRFLVPEVDDHAGAGDDEEGGGFPGEGLGERGVRLMGVG